MHRGFWLVMCILCFLAGYGLAYLNPVVPIVRSETLTVITPDWERKMVMWSGDLEAALATGWEVDHTEKVGTHNAPQYFLRRDRNKPYTPRPTVTPRPTATP